LAKERGKKKRGCEEAQKNWRNSGKEGVCLLNMSWSTHPMTTSPPLHLTSHRVSDKKENKKPGEEFKLEFKDFWGE
jgi:hypothetical protein